MKVKLSLCGVARRGNQFLLGQRLNEGTQALKWEFPGGKAEPGESPAEALRREFEEELQVEPRVESEPFFEDSFENKGQGYRLLAFWVELLQEPRAGEAHVQLQWLTPHAIDGLDLCPSDLRVWEAIKTQVLKSPSPKE